MATGSRVLLPRPWDHAGCNVERYHGSKRRSATYFTDCPGGAARQLWWLAGQERSALIQYAVGDQHVVGCGRRPEGEYVRRREFFMAVTPLILAKFGNLGFISLAQGQPAALSKSQTDALNAYNNAVSDFRSILGQRRAQIGSKQRLPNLPGQALYHARIDMMSAYKDLTDALPSKIGRPNKFKIPPAYFDADLEPLIDEYTNLFTVMQAPPVNAQNSDTPFKDVVDLGIGIARAKGLDAINAEVAGRISLGLFFAETNGNQNIGNARSNTYKGSFQTGPSEDRRGQTKWQAIRKTIIALDPKLLARDAAEEARAGNLDHRFNHWIAVRDGLMNAHAELFPRIPDIAKALPKPIDQMKVFELIQIIPGPTKSALASGHFTSYAISDPTVMGYLRNNSILAFARAG